MDIGDSLQIQTELLTVISLFYDSIFLNVFFFFFVCQVSG